MIDFEKRKKKYLFLCQKYVNENSTLRSVANKYDGCRSTLHCFIQKELKDIDNELYLKCRVQIAYNISVRHIRGGVATKKKYEETNINIKNEN